MTPFDLRDHAHFSKKIPAKILIHQGKKADGVRTWKVLAAYFMDVYFSLIATLMVSTLIDISMANLMLTDSLVVAHSLNSSSSIFTIVFPLVLVGYFYFSFFFNQGQTLGLSMLKCRISIPEMSFQESFRWSMVSIFMIYTLGLGYRYARDFMENHGWGTFKVQDHLYNELVADKVLSPVNLFNVIENHSTTEETQEFVEKEAA